MSLKSNRSENRDVVITVQGGCVNGVFTDIPNLKVVLLDWDNMNDSPQETVLGERTGSVPASLNEMPPETQLAYQLMTSAN